MIFSVFQNIWVFGYSWSTLLWYRCYYPHRSRDSLSPVCRIFKESALGQFFHRVAMSVYVPVYISVYIYVPFSCNFFAWKNWSYYTRGAGLITLVELVLLHAWSPSYYTHGALKTGGVCRASIAHVWSRCVDAWTRQPPLFYFFLVKLCNLSKIVSVLLSASFKRFFVSRMRDFSYLKIKDL